MTKRCSIAKSSFSFLIILENRKENVNLAAQVNHHYDASRSLTPVHSEVTEDSNYTPYFTNSTVKANSSFT